MDGWLSVYNDHLKMIVFGSGLFTNDIVNLKHQGAGQKLMIGWPKHQGVSETPKNADIICEQPLIRMMLCTWQMFSLPVATWLPRSCLCLLTSTCPLRISSYSLLYCSSWVTGSRSSTVCNTYLEIHPNVCVCMCLICLPIARNPSLSKPFFHCSIFCMSSSIFSPTEYLCYAVNWLDCSVEIKFSSKTFDLWFHHTLISFYLTFLVYCKIIL